MRCIHRQWQPGMKTHKQALEVLEQMPMMTLLAPCHLAAKRAMTMT